VYSHMTPTTMTSLPGCDIWPGVLSRAVCARTIAAMHRVASVPGAVLRQGADHLDYAMRACTEHHLAGAQAKEVVDAMRTVAVQALSARHLRRAQLDGPKFCSYHRGGYFRGHRDRSLDMDDPLAVRTRVISLVCLLNDAEAVGDLPIFDGGALVLYVPKPDGTIASVNVPLSAGSIVAFSSELFHEVRPVRSGVRFSAVAWLYTGNLSEEQCDAQSLL
jgi:predicted 2-oxoglutarate/Fe(II)-dependent dioxygenase YbiX